MRYSLLMSSGDWYWEILVGSHITFCTLGAELAEHVIQSVTDQLGR